MGEIEPMAVITGAAGFIGRHAVEAMAAAGHRVIAVDRVEADYPDGVIAHVADLRQATSLLPEGVSGQDGFILIHLAWDMRRDAGYAVQMQQVAILAALLEEWAGRGLQRFIGLGSAEEYGARSGKIVEEDRPVLPLSAYGLAKYSASMLMSSWSARSKVAVIWLRPFLVYGPGQTGNMMLPYAVAQARAGALADFTDGLQERDFVFIDDLTAALVKSATTPSMGAEILNIGFGKPVRVREVLEYLAKALKAEELFRYGNRLRRVGEPERQYADIGRARELLNWRPEIGWEEGIDRIAAFAP